MNLRLLSAGVMAGMFVAASVAHGAVIAQWTMPTSAAVMVNADTVDPNATAAPIARGTSTNAPIFTNDFWTSKPVYTISRSDNTLANVYFEVTLTANAGYALNMDSWSFDGGRGGGATGDRTYNVKSSVEGLDFTTGTSLTGGNQPFLQVRGAAFPGVPNTMQTIPINLSSPAYDNLSSLTMRVYFNTLTTNQNIDADTITFNGALVPIPEPATLSAGLALAAGMLGRRRR